MNRVELERYISERFSDEQQRVIRATGNLVVEACPGSGKTATVAARLAYRLANWSKRGGIAVLSFTNVAEQEVADGLQRMGLSSHPGTPHFLGTINSFIVQWVFRPFAHLVMSKNGLSRAPRLVMDFNERWINQTFALPATLRGFQVVDFSWNRKGNLVWRPPVGYYGDPPTNIADAEGAKRRMAMAGYATHQDSMFWAWEVLRQHPELADSLARRFPEIIVDEVQDTSEIQLFILHKLHQTGHTSFTFVGDADQGIYDFQNAQPALLKRLKAKPEWQPFSLSINYRSSQLICSAVHQFSSLPNPVKARGEDRDCPWSPILLKYDDQEIQDLPASFTKILERKGIALSEAVILTRRNADVSHLLGAKSARSFPPTVPERTRRLIRAACQAQNEDYVEALSQCEKFLLQVVFDSPDASADVPPPGYSSRDWRLLCWQLTQALPDVTLPLGDWLACARVLMESMKVKVTGLGRLFPAIQAASARHPTCEFVERKTDKAILVAKTIHQAKGETHVATMLVATPGTSKQPSEAVDWFAPLDSSGLRPEPVRRAYVGMTRPRKLLVVAIPASVWEVVRDWFGGFEVEG